VGSVATPVAPAALGSKPRGADEVATALRQEGVLRETPVAQPAGDKAVALGADANAANNSHNTPRSAPLPSSAAAPVLALNATAELARVAQVGSNDQRSERSNSEGSPAVSAGSATSGGAGALSWLAPAATGTAGASGIPVQDRLSASPGSPAFAPQLAAQITTYARDGVQHAKLELNPAEMGPLTVQIQLDGNAARVHLAAENIETRQALEQAMPQLAGSLRDSGLTLSGGGVFEQPRQPQQQPSGHPGGNANGGPGRSRDGRGNGASEALGAIAPASGSVTARRQTGMVDLIA
jgi:flagellar hook-length control protein FliK